MWNCTHCILIYTDRISNRKAKSVSTVFPMSYELWPCHIKIPIAITPLPQIPLHLHFRCLTQQHVSQCLRHWVISIEMLPFTNDFYRNNKLSKECNCIYTKFIYWRQAGTLLRLAPGFYYILLMKETLLLHKDSKAWLY